MNEVNVQKSPLTIIKGYVLIGSVITGITTLLFIPITWSFGADWLFGLFFGMSVGIMITLFLITCFIVFGMVGRLIQIIRALFSKK